VEFLPTPELKLFVVEFLLVVEFLPTPELELFVVGIFTNTRVGIIRGGIFTNARVGIIRGWNFYQRLSWSYSRSNIHWRQSQEYYKQIIIA